MFRSLASTVPAIAAATVALLAGPVTAGVIASSVFDVDTQILGLELLGGDVIVDITTTQSGSALSPADPDAVLAQVATNVDVLGQTGVDLDLGVLGVEWVSDDTFDIVFGLSDTSVDVLGVATPVPLSLVPTIDWDVYNLDLAPNEIIANVLQIDTGGIDIVPGGVSWTANSVSITTDALAVVGLGFDARSRFQIETTTTAVPVPASAMALATGLAAMGAMRVRRKRQAR